MTRLQEQRFRKTFRFKASRRRRTSEVRAMASPWTGSCPAARTASRARVRPYERHVAEHVGGHGIADGVARRRMRRADAPGQRMEPEQDRSEVGREIPGEILIRARASARGRGSPAGRRFRRPSTTDPAAGARGARVRPGKGSGPPTTGGPGPLENSRVARRLLDIRSTIPTGHPPTAGPAGQTQGFPPSAGPIKTKTPISQIDTHPRSRLRCPTARPAPSLATSADQVFAASSLRSSARRRSGRSSRSTRSPLRPPGFARPVLGQPSRD